MKRSSSPHQPIKLGSPFYPKSLKPRNIKRITSLVATSLCSSNPSMDSPSRSHLFGDSTRKTLLGFLLFLSLSLAPSFAETQISDELTAYQMLEKYDFPKGILPQGVQSYVLNRDGSFEVYLSGDCEFEVTGGYLLQYKRRITGTVGMGSLTNLRGVRVKVLLLWFGINEVVRSGNELKFYVGPLSASFGLSNFEECPSCRCGFDCADAMVSDS